ncbi:MAG: dihydrofolate reductase family protein [Candidatus Doudnabacteria bacterium]|nr:dihydrofolate reductase family protein [Candidatus Doudnabacteria bacterium]
MNVTLFCAISADGFIATSERNSEWISMEVDAPIWEAEIKKRGCIIVGSKAFYQYLDDVYPFPEVQNIVITSQTDRENKWDNVTFVEPDASKALSVAESLGFPEVLLVGGAKTNGLFLKSGKVNGIILDIHPLLLGSGIKVFEDTDSRMINLQKLSSQELSEGHTLLHYKVV